MKTETKLVHFSEGIELESGEKLNSFDLMIETYGELNEGKSNAVLLCHAFSGNHHAAGSSEDFGTGWWDQLVGPGKSIDTNKYFIVCCNNLGGCAGSSGPSSINPSSQKIFGKSFPQVSVLDWVNSQKMLMDKLNIECWHFVAGGSLGGMQALQWSISYPDKVKKAGIFAAASKSSSQNIAMNEVARESIRKDENFHNGNYYEHKVEESVSFEVENYLQYKGEQFSELFDANSYILMTKVMDSYDAGKDKSLVEALKEVKAEFLIVGFYSDWLYPPERGKEIQIAAMNNNIRSSFVVLQGDHGHDSFLFSSKTYSNLITNFIES